MNSNHSVINWISVLCLMLLGSIQVAAAAETSGLKKINLNHGDIRYLGSNYVRHHDTQVSFTRHSQKVLKLKKQILNFNAEKAQTTTGITINFATDSNRIQLRFLALPGINRGSEFAIYENNEFIQSVKFKAKDKVMTLDFNSKTKQVSEYQITLPSLSNVALTALEIDNDSKLASLKGKRNAKYIAMGDSITHGVGQSSATHLTYPYLLAEQLNLELYNLAVGGGKVSVPTADMLSDFDDVSVMTLLIGYNDWQAPNADINTFQKRYQIMLNTMRANQPKAEIFAITPLFTKKKLSKVGNIPITDYRKVIKKIINKMILSGDDKLHLIEGDTITSSADLRHDKPEDPVHLCVEGAASLATKLEQIISKTNISNKGAISR